MKTALAVSLLFACAGLTHAAILQTITLDLSPAHPGSTLSGTFSLPDTPAIGDTAPVMLSFSDPSNYTPTSLAATILIGQGTPSGFVVTFSPLMFTNLSGTVGQINTRDISLTPFGFARCTSFPCTASGGLQDRSPAVFTSTYTIAPAPVPEPGYSLLLSGLLTAIVCGRRLIRR